MLSFLDVCKVLDGGAWEVHKYHIHKKKWCFLDMTIMNEGGNFLCAWSTHSMLKGLGMQLGGLEP